MNRRRGEPREDWDRRPGPEPDDSWAGQVPEHRWNGPYDDYGWEADQSGLPEFRDPSVHLTEEEQRRVRERHWEPRGDRFQGGERPAGRGRFTGVGPRNYRRPARSIYEDVCDRLTRHGQIDARDMDVSVEDGVVYLRGTAPDRWTKRAAELVAESVAGVIDVQNELRLAGRPASGEQNRVDEVGGSGVWPASGPRPPQDVEVQGMASWGQGERGAAGYQDHGDSEIHPETGKEGGAE